MSDKAWALEQMIKYRLQVDFSRRTIDCRGYNSGWYWDDKKDMYQAIQEAIKDINKF